jgi:uncharacterized membrane protein
MTDTNDTTDSLINRRQALGMAAALGASAVPLAAAEAAAGKKKYRLSDEELQAKFKDPAWNRETTARLEGDTAAGKFVHGYCTGMVMGVRDNEPLKPLFGFEVFSGIRVVKQPNGDYQRMCRELVFYRDLATGEMLDEWTNVYTGEKVKVVDVNNDPFNYVISDHYPDPPNYGGLNTVKPPRRPFLRDWRIFDPDTVVMQSDIHLYYKNALDPAKWPRESSGPMNRVSELFRYVIKREDLENPAKTHLPHHGVWNRVTPWLPWMLMGQAPGHILYAGTFGTVEKPEMVPAPVLRRVKERWPLYLTAPEKWVDPSLSSLEVYARDQKPAPPKAP